MTREQLPDDDDRCEVLTCGKRCRAEVYVTYLADSERVRFCAGHWSDFVTRSAAMRADRGWGYCLAAVTVIQEMTGKTAPTIGRG